MNSTGHETNPKSLIRRRPPHLLPPPPLHCKRQTATPQTQTSAIDRSSTQQAATAVQTCRRRANPLLAASPPAGADFSLLPSGLQAFTPFAASPTRRRRILPSPRAGTPASHCSQVATQQPPLKNYQLW